MGANYGGNGNREYFYIFDGTLVKKVKEAEAVNPKTGEILPTYNRRENKNGDIVYERESVYGVDGMLTKIDWGDGKFGKELILTLEDDDKEYVITVQALYRDGTFQRYAGSIVDQLGLIDFNLPVLIKPYKDLEYNGKAYTGVSIMQTYKGSEDWASVKKLKPELWEKIREAKPKAKEVEGADGPQWDFTQVAKVQKAFLTRNQERLLEFKENAVGDEPEPEAEAEAEGELKTDDLPF